MKIYSKIDRKLLQETFENGYKKGYDKSTTFLNIKHEIAIQKLSDQKDLKIAELELEIKSNLAMLNFIKHEYDKLAKERQYVILESKKNERVSQDLLEVVSKQSETNSNLIQQVGNIASEAKTKLIKE
jgi:hypothetical protein